MTRIRTRGVVLAPLFVLLAILFAPASTGASPGAEGQVGERNVSTLDPTRLRYDQHYREQLGLPSSEAYIRSLYSKRSAGELPGADTTTGTLFTSVEKAEVDARDRETAANARAVRSYLSRADNDLGGGMYIDHARGGVLMVGVTGEPQELRTLLGDLVPFPDRLEVVKVAHSLQSLDNLHNQIVQDLDDLEASGVVVSFVSTDEVHNAVRVGVPRPSAAVRDVLDRRYPNATLEIVEAQRPALTGEEGLFAPPLMGGLELIGEDSLSLWGCSSAFIAESGARPAGVTFHLLTAGHCGNVGSVWTQFGYPVGSIQQETFQNNSTADSARIRINASDMSRDVLRMCSTACTYSVMIGQQAAADDVVGENTCLSGYQTWRCGTIVNRNFTANYPGNTILEMREVSFASVGGDSGGAYLYNATAKGIQSGNVIYGDGTTHAIYSHIGNATALLGVSVSTACLQPLTPLCR